MPEPTLAGISAQLSQLLLELRRGFHWIVGIQGTGFLVILGSVVSLFVALKGGGNQGYGAVAQLGERGLCKPEVVGSIPISSTKHRGAHRSDTISPTRVICDNP